MEDSVYRSRVAVLWRDRLVNEDVAGRLVRLELLVKEHGSILEDVIRSLGTISRTQAHTNQVLAGLSGEVPHG